MDTHAFDQPALAGLDVDAHLFAPGTLQVLTSDEADLVSGGFAPVVAFLAGAAIGYLAMKYL